MSNIAQEEIIKPSSPKSNNNSSINSTPYSALNLLLQEDPLLTKFNLTSLSSSSSNTLNNNNNDSTTPTSEESPFLYAAALINADTATGWFSSPVGEDNTNDNSTTMIEEKANEALAEVNRKLALVTSLAERLSREKPEYVAGPLLKLHGFALPSSMMNTMNNTSSNSNTEKQQEETKQSTTTTTTLATTREQCERLSRQAQVLDSVAKRVENTLLKHKQRMSSSTTRLSNVLQANQVLKMIMKLRFESKKIQGMGSTTTSTATGAGNYDWLEYSSSSSVIDLRDLTRAAASISIMEELLNDELLNHEKIDIVEQMRPEVKEVALVVRKAAAKLLKEATSSNDDDETSSHNGIMTRTSTSTASISKLGATLQVFYHLGELPDAAWSVVTMALERAGMITGKFLNPSAIQRLLENAKLEAKSLAEKEILQGVSGGTTAATAAYLKENKHKLEMLYNRALKKKMREKKAEAASIWANGIYDAALQVWTLYRVLLRKCDSATRQNFLDVVNLSTIPDKFTEAQKLLEDESDSKATSRGDVKNSLFSLFWNQMSILLGKRIQKLLKFDNGGLASDVATFYPAIRAASLDILNSIQDTMKAGSITSTSLILDEASFGNSMNTSSMMGCGIMGGSSSLDDAIFFGWINNDTNVGTLGGLLHNGDDMESNRVGADSWTKPESSNTSSIDRKGSTLNSGTISPVSVSQTSSALSSILSSPEWLSLQGSNSIGLHPMQQAFVQALQGRLSIPLRSMFVEAADAVDENGIALTTTATLPTEKEMKKLETCFREELSIADPREGGGEFSMTSVISEEIVDVVEQFCQLAKNATSRVTEDGMLVGNRDSPSEELLRDMKIASIMATLSVTLRNLPDNTFVAPYRPAHSLQHEEAANMCQIALMPALHEIQSLVKGFMIHPLSKVLNKLLAASISHIHRGVYLEASINSNSNMSGEASFVQEKLEKVYDNISTNILSRLPAEYSFMISSKLVTFSIYCFVSNVFLVRPLGEMGRLKITQDLGDFELLLEHLILKTGGTGTTSASLSHIKGGKPYSELRAVRQMLFWNGLEDKTLSVGQVAKSLLREAWVKDVRPSTIFHYLFSFAPKLLSSPHHANRMSADEYVKTLVNLDGSIDDGEARAWMTTMSCCDAYQQRESIDGSYSDGDKRVPAILMIIGPELLRRRRQ